MAVEIYPAARERLLQIWDYTERTWGEEQADAYVRGIVAAAQDLWRQQIHWKPIRGDRFPGAWYIRHEHDYLFFRELPDGDIGIISILHENMDLPARFRDDVERES